MIPKFKLDDRIKHALQVLLTIALLGSILYLIKPATLYSEIKLVSPFWLILALLVTPVTVLFRAVRLQRFVYSFAKKISLKAMYGFALIGMFFGFITPARLGDFVKVYFIHKKAKLDLKKSLAAALFDRIYDLLVLITLAILGAAIFLGFAQRDGEKLWFAVFVAVLFITPFFHHLLNIILKFIERFKYFKKHASFLKNYEINYKTNAYGILSTICIWLSLVVQAHFIFKAMNISLPWIIPLAIVPMMALSNFIPISISGMGVREYITAIFLPIVGITFEKSVVFSLIYTFVGLLVPACFGAVAYILACKKK